MDVHLDAGALRDAPVALLEAAVRRTLADAGVDGAELSLTLLDDEAIRALNRTWLDRDHTTDVIAFALGADPLVGDVYVGWEQAERQSAELGIERDEELARLAIHGTLHVLGHDHPEGEGREGSAMFALQERLLREVLGGA